VTRRRSDTVERMTIQRMDHAGIAVDDLAAAMAFFVELAIALADDAGTDGAVAVRGELAAGRVDVDEQS
jgi:hypothetical protein